MKMQIPVPIVWNSKELWNTLRSMSLDAKSHREIWICYQTLQLWNEELAGGKNLTSLSHHSDGDDPPDVMAEFEGGTTLAVEHTSTVPAHMHQFEKISRGDEYIVKNGCFVPPRSMEPPRNGRRRAEVLIDVATDPYGEWASVEEEIISLLKAVKNAIEVKIKKLEPCVFPGRVLIVLEDSIETFPSFGPEALKGLLSRMPRNALWNEIIVAFHVEGRYSAMYSHELGFKEKALQ